MRVATVWAEVLWLAVLLHPMAAVAESSLTQLGDLPGGSFFSSANDVSADGSIVVGYSIPSNGAREAVMWDAVNGLQGLGDLPGGPVLSYATGISADGSIIVGTGSVGNGSSSCCDEAFIWDATNGMQGLGYLSGSSTDFSFASGISADGSTIVGGSRSGLGPEAASWDTTNGNSVQGHGDLPGGGFSSQATAVSSDGSVIVGWGKSSAAGTANDAFIWDAVNGIQSPGDLPGGVYNSCAIGVSGDGTIVVGAGRSTLGSEGFVWDATNGMLALGSLPGGSYSSEARDISADGSIVVGWANTGTEEAFIWDSVNGMRSLIVVLSDLGVDVTGWDLRRANAVSADGNTIVGDGINPAGAWQGFVAVLDFPVQAPVAGWPVSVLLVLALASIGCFALWKVGDRSEYNADRF